MSNTLPDLVAHLTHACDAWIVGSAADPENVEPRDYDVVVPFSAWNIATNMIPRDATVNSFGGWKCISCGVEVDVWPGDLGWVLQRPRCKWAWHPLSGVRITKV